MANIVTRPDSTYPVLIKPYKLDLSQFTEKVRDNITFEITNVSDQKLDLTLISAYDKNFKVTLPKSIAPGKSAKGTLKLTKSAIKSSFEKSFTFELNDEKTTRFTVPVKRTLRLTSKTSASAAKASGGK